MAEQQTEQDDLAEVTPGYKPPAKKTLDEIVTTDAEDESLKKYKQQLLGDVSLSGKQCVFPEDPRNVIVTQLRFIPKLGEGGEEVVLDLKGDVKKFKDQKFVIKEGCKYTIAVKFYVQREIVAGLRYNQITLRKGIKVDKDSFMVGSYGPKMTENTFVTPEDEAPTGMMARGSYSVKSSFTDDDKTKYLDWEWFFEIKKDWK